MLSAAFKIAVFGAARMIVIETVSAHTVAVFEAFAERASPSLGIEFVMRVFLADEERFGARAWIARLAHRRFLPRLLSRWRACRPLHSNIARSRRKTY